MVIITKFVSIIRDETYELKARIPEVDIRDVKVGGAALVTFDATPNEKITWDKLTKDTPMFVIESDATIVVPLMLTALMECKENPDEANKLIEQMG